MRLLCINCCEVAHDEPVALGAPKCYPVVTSQPKRTIWRDQQKFNTYCLQNAMPDLKTPLLDQQMNDLKNDTSNKKYHRKNRDVQTMTSLTQFERYIKTDNQNDCTEITKMNGSFMSQPSHIAVSNEPVKGHFFKNNEFGKSEECYENVAQKKWELSSEREKVKCDNVETKEKFGTVRDLVTKFNNAAKCETRELTTCLGATKSKVTRFNDGSVVVEGPVLTKSLGSEEKISVEFNIDVPMFPSEQYNEIGDQMQNQVELYPEVDINEGISQVEPIGDDIPVQERNDK